MGWGHIPTLTHLPLSLGKVFMLHVMFLLHPRDGVCEALSLLPGEPQLGENTTADKVMDYRSNLSTLDEGGG